MANEFADGLDLDDLPGDKPEPTPKPEPKAKAEPKVEAKPEKPEPPKKNVHSLKLEAKARSMGATQEYLDTHTSAEIWEDIHDVEAQRPAAPAKKAEPEPEEDDDALLAKLEEELDPRVAKLLKKQNERLKAADTKLAKLDKLEEAENKRAARSRDDMGDAGFAALPAKYKAIFGDGSFADCDPGQHGWRARAWQEAKVNFDTDSQSTINKKVLAAAERLAKGKVADDDEEEDEEEVPVPAAKKKKTPPKDPESGRFTVEQFNGSKIAKGSDRQTGLDQLSDVEGVRQILRANGDPRGHRSSISETDMDDLP